MGKIIEKLTAKAYPSHIPVVITDTCPFCGGHVKWKPVGYDAKYMVPRFPRVENWRLEAETLSFVFECQGCGAKTEIECFNDSVTISRGTDKLITKQALFDAGFKVGGTHENLFKLEHGVYKIMIGPAPEHVHGKMYHCTVDLLRERVSIASAEMSYVKDFNKLMDLMNIDFRLKEE